MANNHAADYGSVGLADTLAAIANSPIPVVGIGADADAAYAPAYVDLRGTTVALLAAMQVPDWTAAHFAAGPALPRRGNGFRPRAARGRGPSGQAEGRRRRGLHALGHGVHDLPEPAAAVDRQGAGRRPAPRSSSGAHAHKLQGAGWLGDTYVDYGLGNFVWWRRQTTVETWTGVLTLTLTGSRVCQASWLPMVVGASGLPGRAERRRAGQARDVLAGPARLQRPGRAAVAEPP